MKLIDVYHPYWRMETFPMLFQLLNEREPHQNISHQSMPSWEAHLAFLGSRPYHVWYAIVAPNGDDFDIVGAAYLTRQREIGIGILKSHRGRGYATWAVEELMRLHPGRFLANINPANEASIALFRKFGFGGPIQITLEKI